MRNKLGINDYELEKVEYKLVKTKIELLDYTYTFNNNLFDLKYLEDLNEFLFGDIYYKDILGIRKMNEIEKNYIDELLSMIVQICIKESENTEKILNLIEKLWYYQPLLMGNTRTLISFLKILNNAFLLDIEIDIEKNIESRPSIFYEIARVNQKGLTK